MAKALDFGPTPAPAAAHPAREPVSIVELPLRRNLDFEPAAGADAAGSECAHTPRRSSTPPRPTDRGRERESDRMQSSSQGLPRKKQEGPDSLPDAMAPSDPTWTSPLCRVAGWSLELDNVMRSLAMYCLFGSGRDATLATSSLTSVERVCKAATSADLLPSRGSPRLWTESPQGSDARGLRRSAGAFAAKRFRSQGLASMDDHLECTIPEECTVCFVWQT
jgi:hypothetical protein